MVRTFISIEFDNEEIVNNVKEIQDKLKKLDARLTLVNSNILHSTLEFLGEITEDQVKQVSKIIEELDFSIFRISVKQPGVLPSEKYVRVIFCKLEGDIDSLRVIQRNLREKLRRLGYKVDSRAFKPHLTIARVKSISNKYELIKVINDLSEFNCGEQKISSIKLKKSVVKSTGPEYTTLYEKHAKPL